MMRFLFGILMCLVCMPSVIQARHSNVFEFPADTPLIGLKGKPKIFLTLDKTSSFVGGKSASTNEIRIGLEFKRKLRIGVGGGSLTSDIVEKRVLHPPKGLNDSVVDTQLYLTFFSINGEYIFYDSKKWQITMPIGVNFGSSYFDYFGERFDEGGVLLLTAQGVATYRILRWVGLSGGVGFRQMLISNSKVEESFNSPVYVFKIRIFLGEVYKSVFPRGISGKRNPPYSNQYWD